MDGAMSWRTVNFCVKKIWFWGECQMCISNQFYVLLVTRRSKHS